MGDDATVPDRERDRILPLVSVDRNRELLADRLSGYELVDGGTGTDLPTFDLCVVDWPTLQRERERLEQAKAAEAPSFLPILLVADSKEAESLGGNETGPIDEVLEMPVSGAVLVGRVESLLRTRRQSVELSDRNRELAEANRQLDKFASTVSHDLRNPLNLAMALVRRERDDRGSESLERAAAALERIETLTNDLLQLARQGRGIDDPDRLRFAAVAEGSWALVASDAAEIQVRDDFTFVADESRLRQLFENLFRNAIAHGGAGVTVGVGRIDGEAGGFYVEDDGVGIPEAEREHVFESGYTSSEDGTGFGLDIVAGIAEAHGWDVRLREGTDGGARFEFTGVDLRD